MGLDVYLKGIKGIKGIEEIGEAEEIKSIRYPDHCWTSVYLRSSYNSSGFNNVVRYLIDKDLYNIFNPEDRSDFEPDWEAAQNIATEMLNQLDSIKNPLGAVFVCNPEKVVSEQAAIKVVRGEMKELGKDPVLHSYSSKKGLFYLDGLEIIAAISGTGIPDNRKGVYLVHKLDITWYKQALRILVEEFIPLGIKYSKTSRLHWSG